MSSCYAYSSFFWSNNVFFIPLIKMYVLYFELRECSAVQSLAGGQKQVCREGEILSNLIWTISSALMWREKNTKKTHHTGNARMHFYSAQPAYTQIKYSNTLKSVCFLTPDLLSAALQEFLLLGLSSLSRGGQQLPGWRGCSHPGEQGPSCGDAPLSSCCWSQAYVWTWWLPSALDICLLSWSMGHDCGSAQGMENNICGTLPALQSAVRKVFCSGFP